MNVEMTSPLMAWGQGMMLNLALHARQQASRYQPLLSLLPFLGLSCPRVSAVRAHGRNALPPTPWLLLRWLGWMGATGGAEWPVASHSVTGSMHTAAVTRQLLAEDGPQSAMPAAAAPAPLLALLAPLLQLSAPIRPEMPRSQRSAAASRQAASAAPRAEIGRQPARAADEPARPSAPQAAPLVWNRRSPSGEPAAPTTGAERPSPRTAAGQPDTRAATPAQVAQAARPRAFPALNPSLLGLLGAAANMSGGQSRGMAAKRPFAPPALVEPLFARPGATWRPGGLFAPASSAPELLRPGMQPTAAWPTAGTVGADPLSPLPALSTARAAPATSGSDHAAENQTPSPVPGLPFIAGTIERLVRREVTAEVRRQRADEAQLSSQASEPAMPAAAVLLDDDSVRQMMVRMRDLAQEERFRMGRMS